MKRAFSPGKIALPYLIAAASVLIAGTQLSAHFHVQEKSSHALVQLAAAHRMAQAEEALFDCVRQEEIEILYEDINQTGLIGPEFTPLTTTLGHIEAKRSALNPNFAALLVKYFDEAGLKAGDQVAVGASGSFPGLALATLAAANEMKLDVRVIASYGASMYGATRPELPLPKMFRVLRERGLAEYQLLATSPGGNDDHGESALYDDARDIIRALAMDEGVEFIDLPTLEESIARRLELFGPNIKCFVNVGGASANSGSSSYTLAFPNGLVTNPPAIPTTPNRGLMYEYAARGVPVINMLNVSQLCIDNGLPVDPSPLPSPGQGGVYLETRYHKGILFVSVLLAFVTLALGRRRFR